MRKKGLRYFMLFFSVMFLFSMRQVIIFASTESGLLQIGNHNKVASPGELTTFDITIANNEPNTQTFLICPAWDGSVLWLSLDSVYDQKVYDFSSYGNHGTINGTTLVDGKIGKALKFHGGADDYVSVENSIGVIQNFTICFWEYPTDFSGHQTYIHESSGNSILIMRWDNGYVQMYLGDTTTPGYHYGNTQLTLNEWNHCVFTYDGATIRFFLNGNETTMISGGTTTGDLNLDSEFWIGAEEESGANPLNGILDEILIFDRALTAQEIRWLYNNSWSESLSRYNIELGPEESTQITFSAMIPEDARAGYIQKFLLTAFPVSNPEHVETQTVTVEVLPKYGVDLSLDENEKNGKPGEILNFLASIRNLGNIEDTYDIQAEGGEGWNLSLPVESITIPAKEVGSFNVSVTVPLDALSGDYTSFRIQAASRGNQNLTTNVNGTAIARATYRVNITSDPELRQASPGSEAIFSLEIKNLGTAPDTIGLEAENLIGWDIKVDPSSISLEIEETGKTTVRVRVPENALIGQTNTIKIHAVSGSDPTVSANSSISIEIVTPFWDIPDVRFIVGLSIGVLVGATLISTIILRRAKINRKENRRS